MHLWEIPAFFLGAKINKIVGAEKEKNIKNPPHLKRGTEDEMILII